MTDQQQQLSASDQLVAYWIKFGTGKERERIVGILKTFAAIDYNAPTDEPTYAIIGDAIREINDPEHGLGTCPHQEDGATVLYCGECDPKGDDCVKYEPGMIQREHEGTLDPVSENVKPSDAQSSEAPEEESATESRELPIVEPVVGDSEGTLKTCTMQDGDHLAGKVTCPACNPTHELAPINPEGRLSYKSPYDPDCDYCRVQSEGICTKHAMEQQGRFQPCRIDDACEQGCSSEAAHIRSIERARVLAIIEEGGLPVYRSGSSGDLYLAVDPLIAAITRQDGFGVNPTPTDTNTVTTDAIPHTRADDE